MCLDEDMDYAVEGLGGGMVHFLEKRRISSGVGG